MADPGSKHRSGTRRFVMPLIILAVAAVLLLWGRQREGRDLEQVEAAVRELVREVAATPVTSPAPGPVAQRINLSASGHAQLIRALEAQPAGLPGLDIRVEPGDAEPPYGDGSATHRAYIDVQGVTPIALRLHHPGDPARIVVLGYWRP